jgi:NAD(P)H-quinone oxidoreductase subunit 5
VSPLSRLEQLAALLIASAAMVKCAQFPMHGWLIQVVEAPTPVSALLHAGVINLGGFLLLMAPLMRHADLANWLLLIVAGLTCVAAALITMTRVSVKVLLAWSTVAQMGLMLVECALGQYGLALLHLVAHSCYKAYAFLAAGSRGRELPAQAARTAAYAPRRHPADAVLAIAVLPPRRGPSCTGYLGTDASPGCCWPAPGGHAQRARQPGHSGSLLLRSASPRLLLASPTPCRSTFYRTSRRSADCPGGAGALVRLLFTLLLGAYWVLRQHGDSALGRACTATSTPVSTSMSGPPAPPWRSGRRSCPSALRRASPMPYHQNTEELS